MELTNLFVGVALGVLLLAATLLVIRFAGGTHHGHSRKADGNRGGDHAVLTDEQYTQCPTAALFIIGSDGTPLRFDLTTSPVRVGRSPDNDLIITEDVSLQVTVSRRHARLYYDSHLGRWAVRDASSRNGTYVDGVRADHSVLQDGAWVTFGGVHALFREMR